MTDQRPTPLDTPPASSRTNALSGGVFLAVFPVIGAIIGGMFGQPSIGLVAGLALGIVLAIAVWLVDRAKGRS